MSGRWDVVVIGGGPGGCTVASRLAAWGRRVLLLEGERFPRPHVAASLSPASWEVFDALGAGDRVRDAGFVGKPGSTFVWGPDRERWSVYYGPADEAPRALQVRRDELDRILLEHAAGQGADVRQGSLVEDLDREGDRVTGVRFRGADGRDERAEAAWVVDASGRDAFVARRLRLMEFRPGLASSAIWAEWEGSGRLPGMDAGNTLLVDHEHGLSWHVPLDERRGLACVGAALRIPAGDAKADAERAYDRAIAASVVLAELLGRANRVGPLRVADARSYCASRMAGPGWLLAGDAACFVDPVISGGVQLALDHGMLAALVLNTVLGQSEVEDRAIAYYDQVCRGRYEAFSYASTNVYRSAGGTEASAPAAGRPPAAGPPGVPAGPGVQAGAGARLKFLGMVAGLPEARLVQALGEHTARRKQAEERGGARVEFGEEEGFAFLTRLSQRRRLEDGRAGRIGEDLDDDSVVRLAPGVSRGDQLFLPTDGTRRTLVRRRAVANRFGDRFQASPELEVLFEVLDGGRPYADLERRFLRILRAVGAEAAGAGNADFRRWLGLLADQALVEWQRLDARPEREPAGSVP